jgi:hypothetical protein
MGMGARKKNRKLARGNSKICLMAEKKNVRALGSGGPAEFITYVL